MNRLELVDYLDGYLRMGEIADYGPQAWQADMLLVHHGILWRSVERIAGPLGQRVRLMMKHGLNLYAAHLSLDAHPEVGNNAVLAQMLGVTVREWWCAPTDTPIAVLGTLARPTPLAELVAQVEDKLNTQARVLVHGPEQAQTMAILSGFGADEVAEAKALGADTFLTGETSHANYWAASDYGLNVIFAGHYATETVGVQALGRHLAEKFGVTVRFFDFPTNM